MIFEREGSLYYQYDNETVRIDAWGKNAVRVRATKNREFIPQNWALDEEGRTDGLVEINTDRDGGGKVYANMDSGKDRSEGCLRNGKVMAVVNADGVLAFYNEEKKLMLKENWRRLKDKPSIALNTVYYA